MTSIESPILQTVALGPQWQTVDPFLFCAHHDDHYPAANAQLGPAAALDGRQLGMDFAGIDGWNMYHGSVVPGFPQHPHRGFETVTYVRHGFIDHADSLGATARFGRGDVQWMTAGAGIQHCEMFPLLDPDGPNHVQLFQIWLNLPAVDKMVDPYFTMLWDHEIPRVTHTDAAGRATEVTVIAGSLDDRAGPTPPPDSWASRPEANVAIWHLNLEPHATWTLPATDAESGRVLYLFDGDEATVAGQPFGRDTGVALDAAADVVITAGAGGLDAMLLQGRPIAEPVAQQGPFVMNTRAEIGQAIEDYQATGFGGWPWGAPDPNHGPDQGRFAIHADGRREDVPG